ncbi:AAA family ATPase [Longimicrobium sp.]|uniref:AAA family ATPase n=1 Tax=Longimicrobium sp. TaxID=2029185 RepID=UPI002E344207|nr:AAA family ATPase [Longimicrobium sp.]
MRLSTARIRGFRSVEDVVLDNCGALNVLIGKNNAGKSNLLLGINAFFTCIADGKAVSIDPPIGRTFDFHGNVAESPIDLILTFELSEDEAGQIRESIVAVAPQMRNAVENLDSPFAVVVAVSVPPETPAYAYVREIKLLRINEAGVISEHLIVRVPPAAAAELAKNARSAKTRYAGAEAVRKRTEAGRRYREGWERVKLDFGAYSSVSTYDGTIAPEFLAQLNELARNSESFDRFQVAAAKLAENLESEATALQLSPLRTNLETFAGNEDRLPSYSRQILEMIAGIPVLYLTERREPIGRAEASLLLELKVSRGGTDQLRRIQQTVSNLLGVEIDAFRAEGVGRRGDAAELDVDRFVVQVNGAGIREALRLVLDYELKQPSLLLVEEPEIHLHPALETTVLRYLKSIGLRCQIFVTTHSTNFLDTAEMKNVYLVSREGATQVEQIDTEEAEAILPKELGLRLSSLFMYDRLVFVEGPIDEEIVREWASTMDVNLGRANVGFITIGGVKNFAHYANTHTLEFLARRQVAIWFLLDRDERDDQEVAQLKERLGDTAQLIALERREIENYLLVPRAIAVYLEERFAAENVSLQREISTEQVARDMDECADELLPLTVRNRVAKLLCTPVYPDRRAILAEENLDDFVSRLSEEMEHLKQAITDRESRILFLVEAERADIERRWVNDKLSLVPGDLLLDCICRRYGVRFRKERDSVRLASKLLNDEIAPEIRRFLSDVGTA